MTRWHDRQAGFARCCSIRSRTVSMRVAPAALVSSSAGTFGGGGGGGEPIITSITHLPRMTGEVRSATDVSRSTLPLPSRPRRSSGDRDALEFVAGDVRDPVVPRQARVDERVVGRQQVEHAAIVADQAVEEELGFAHHRAPERPVEVRIQDGVGQDLLDVGEPQPLPGKPRRQRIGTRIGQHPLHLAIERPGRRQRARGRRLQQRASGPLPQMKNDSRDASARSSSR